MKVILIRNFNTFGFSNFLNYFYFGMQRNLFHLPFFLDGLIWEPDIFLARQVKHNTNSAKRYCRFKI